MKENKYFNPSVYLETLCELHNYSKINLFQINVYELIAVCTSINQNIRIMIDEELGSDEDMQKILHDNTKYICSVLERSNHD